MLAEAFPEHSRAALQRAFEAGLVRRNGRIIAKSDEVKAGDTLEFSLPEIVPAELKPVAIPLDVLYEDEHLLAVNKAAGMVVHPGVGTGEDTLVHALLAHCAGGLSGVGGVERPGIVHRLDKETSGVLLVAKNDAAHRGTLGAVCRAPSAQGIPRAGVRRAAAEERGDRTRHQPSSGASRTHDRGRGRPPGAHRLGDRGGVRRPGGAACAAGSTAAAPTRSACT